ncbi:MAG: class I SAM-dependent methyltransferase [Anaerolineae bacterium]|nr:class I SAM-dependent methyltransferase [Anaerolineae bacterium]
MAQQRLYEHGRLVYYRQAADADYWDTHWQHQNPADLYRGAYKGYLDRPFEDTLMRYLPRDRLILEAGCGLAQLVLTLRVRGLAVEGVEWGRETVRAVNSYLPDVPVRVGDVTALDVPDGHYGGYISVGVTEHRQAGPAPFLQEAYRVLEPGGIACISVPYLHPLRRLKAALGLYGGPPAGLPFYQYAFSRQEYHHLLREHGFEIVQTTPYDGFKGLRDELPALRSLLRWRFIGWRLQRWLQRSHRVHVCGHMMMIVCRKPAQ